MGGTEMRRALWWTLWLLLTGLIGSGLLLARSLAPRHPAAAHAPKQELKLFETVTAKGKRGKGLAAAAVALRINPGKPEEAEDYYNTVRKALGGFPQPTLHQSKIPDMLVHYGFPALLSPLLEVPPHRRAQPLEVLGQEGGEPIEDGPAGHLTLWRPRPREA